MAKIYDCNEFADDRVLSDKEMTARWVGNSAKDFKPSDRFYDSDFLENNRLSGVAMCENFREVILQRKRDNFDNLPNHEKIAVLIDTFDLVSISEHKPIEVAKVAIKAKEMPKKPVEFIANEKAKVVRVEKPKKVAKFINRSSLF